MGQFVLPELNAMQQIATIVSELTPAERKRVAAWLSEYAAQEDEPVAAPAEDEPDAAPEEPAEDAEQTETPAGQQPATFAELYEAVAPKKGAQKAVAAAYWLEVRQGQQSWKASEVNKLLKSIDVKVSSVSIVLTNAVKAKDPLVIELARLGDSERSRKTFRLSESGLAYVESQLV